MAGADYDTTADVYIAFTPEQIKSATGNRGTFDAANPDILLSRNARPETRWHGDRAEYTGKTQEMHGGLFHEIQMMEGHLKGQSKWTQQAPPLLASQTPAELKANGFREEVQRLRQKRQDWIASVKAAFEAAEELKPEKQTDGPLTGFAAFVLDCKPNSEVK